MKIKNNEKKRPRLAGLILLGCGLSFIAAGVMRGEMEIVFRKAVNICLECIGIG